MARDKNDITVRNFKGSSVPVGSRIGKILINSKDSTDIAQAIRETVKGKSQTVRLSNSTIASLKAARTE